MVQTSLCTVERGFEKVKHMFFQLYCFTVYPYLTVKAADVTVLTSSFLHWCISFPFFFSLSFFWTEPAPKTNATMNQSTLCRSTMSSSSESLSSDPGSLRRLNNSVSNWLLDAPSQLHPPNLRKPKRGFEAMESVIYTEFAQNGLWIDCTGLLFYCSDE